MDLFSINRFTGDETPDVITEEKNKLNKVLDRINKKKRRKIKKKKYEAFKTILSNESTLFKPIVMQVKADVPQGPQEWTRENDCATEGSDQRIKRNNEKDPGTIEEFKIIGSDTFDKKSSYKRILPTWLRSPTLISSDLQKLTELISESNLNEKLIFQLEKCEIKYMFPVQAKFIPWELDKSKNSSVIHMPDVCVSAPTGSGKTIAFAIPILQYLLGKLTNRNMTFKVVRALLVLPTQSLALQIYRVFKFYTTGTKIAVGVITSNDKTFKNEQKNLFTQNSVWHSKSNNDIIICTAGRLIDHLKNTRAFNLKYLEYIIIDEADRILDSMQDDWLHYLGMHIRPQDQNFVGTNVLSVSSIKKRTEPQKLLFSATLSSDPEKLIKLSLFQPKSFTCATNKTQIKNQSMEVIQKYVTPNELTEKYTICSVFHKPLILYKIITDIMNKSKSVKIIVFVNEIDTGHRLNTLLYLMSKRLFTVKTISDKTPRSMSRMIIELFSVGKINVLICTNLIARGISIPNVDCVISYSSPSHIKTYIHRAGRTARGGMGGVCITILEEHEENFFFKMLQGTRSVIKSLEKIQYNEEDLKSLSSLYEKSLKQLKFKIQNQNRRALMKNKRKKIMF